MKKIKALLWATFAAALTVLGCLYFSGGMAIDQPTPLKTVAREDLHRGQRRAQPAAAAQGEKHEAEDDALALEAIIGNALEEDPAPPP